MIFLRVAIKLGEEIRGEAKVVSEKRVHCIRVVSGWVEKFIQVIVPEKAGGYY